MDELEEELRRNDATEFAGRLVRFREIAAWLDLPEDGLSIGPDEASQAFQDARFSYVNGFWLAAIIMSQTSVERDIAWRLSQFGVKRTERMEAQKLINHARLRGLISVAEADDLERLRNMRNDFAHFRVSSRYWKTFFSIKEAMMNDLESEGLDVNLVLQPDAKDAVRIATNYFLSISTRQEPLPNP